MIFPYHKSFEIDNKEDLKIIKTLLRNKMKYNHLFAAFSFLFLYMFFIERKFFIKAPKTFTINHIILYLYY